MNSPTTSEQDTTAAVRAAAVVFGAMIAFQIAGKATQNALFLSTFNVGALTSATIGAAALTIVVVVATSRLMSRFGPGPVVTATFTVSGTLQLLEWALYSVRPGLAAVVIYLHYYALGALLISGFWSVINERFDPRTLKRGIGSIGTAGAIGGLVGGVTAFTSASVAVMLPLLAFVHLFCGFALGRVHAVQTGAPRADAPMPLQHAVRALTATTYMRTLVAVVLVATISEGLLDFVFKAQAKGAFDQRAELMRLFALFYLGAGILSFVVQTGLSARALEKLGLARTAGALPWTVVFGSASALAFPGLSSAIFARGAEMVSRNTLYRSAYELLFTPMRPADKRAVKPLVDVGVVRVGDALAAGIFKLALLFAGTAGLPLALVLATALALTGIALTVRLHAGYVATLERSLLSRAVHLQLDDVTDSTTRSTLMRTIAEIARVGAPERQTPTGTELIVPREPSSPRPASRIERLGSRDAGIVRTALAEAPLDANLVPAALGLLAWDDVAATALQALQSVASDHTSVLVAGLLDRNEDFTVRRRIPSALVKAKSREGVDGLVAGLGDSRFEVRFWCGRALARMLSEDPSLAVKDDLVHAAVLREVTVGRGIWESQRVLDRPDQDAMQTELVDEELRHRASRSLEHVFTLLSLVMPPQPLRIAFRGLHASDPQLRGTALEYLEVAMPVAVRDKLWPLLDDRPRRTSPPRPREEIIADLLASRDDAAIPKSATGETRS